MPVTSTSFLIAFIRAMGVSLVTHRFFIYIKYKDRVVMVTVVTYSGYSLREAMTRLVTDLQYDIMTS